MLARVGGDEPLALPAWHRLQMLVGIEVTCDPVLLRRPPVTGEAARELLERIRDRLGR